MDYSNAIRKITADYARRADDAAALKERLINENDDFYENERALRLCEIGRAKGKKVDSQALLNERKKILASIGISESDLVAKPLCDACGDTGYRDGKVCACAIKLALESKDFSGLKPRFIEEFDLGVYGEKSRPRMESILEKLKKYISTFPAKGVENLIFTGNPGGGKTFAAEVVQGEIMKRGYSVAAMSAFAFVQNMLAYHTDFDGDKSKHLSPILDCDLLIIDDLGTESILKNVTLEYLYLVLNERMIDLKHTLVTTNLAPSDIGVRYGARIESRLFDKRLSYTMTFPDEDLRNGMKKR